MKEAYDEKCKVNPLIHVNITLNLRVTDYLGFMEATSVQEAR